DSSMDTTDHREPDLVAGGRMYHLYCAACHQPDGRGSELIKSASFVGPDSPLHRSDDELVRVVREGVTRAATEEPAMPPFGQALTTREIKDILGYIRAEFGKSP
ncbi:MAG: cytochrome c, partial [Opitutales bacterium]